MITRYFEFIGGSSAKFWEASYPNRPSEPPEWVARWGRIGTKGQSKCFPAYSRSEARDDAVGKINEKLSKGYVERPAMNAVQCSKYEVKSVSMGGASRMFLHAKIHTPAGANNGVPADRPHLKSWPLQKDRLVAVNLDSTELRQAPHLYLSDILPGVYQVVVGGTRKPNEPDLWEYVLQNIDPRGPNSAVYQPVSAQANPAPQQIVNSAAVLKQGGPIIKVNAAHQEMTPAVMVSEDLIGPVKRRIRRGGD